MNGRVTAQYLRAEELSKFTKLEKFTGELQYWTYTGHSLGGGLATVAALSKFQSMQQYFNSAALHPDSAKKLSLPYDKAMVHLVDNLVNDR